MTTQRAAIAALLLLNLAAGLFRYAVPDPHGQGLLWDLAALMRVSGGCDPAAYATIDAPEICQRLPPYLPLAWSLFVRLAVWPWETISTLWYLVAGAGLLAVFTRESLALRDRDGSLRPLVAAVALVSLVAFKGTSLGLFAGQPTVLATLLLYVFVMLEGRSSALLRAVAVVCLALAAGKPNLALPFFAWLALRRDLRGLAAAVATTAALHGAASFDWIGPAGYWHLLSTGQSTIEGVASNVAGAMGASGRVDLAPLLASVGIDSSARLVVSAALLLAAAAALILRAPTMDPRLLLVDVNLVAFALLYHRDYDVVLLLLLAMPLVWERRANFGLLACCLALPAVLPLQWIHMAGMKWAPDAALLWNLTGSSMVVALLGIGAWLHLAPAPTLRRGRAGRAAESRATQKAPRKR